MNVDVYNGYVKISCVDNEGYVREYVTSNEELLDFMLEVFDGDRLEVSELPNPLKSIMLNCVKGEFIQVSAKPDILEEQLKQYGLGNLYKYDGEVFKFNFKILNHIIYKK